MSTNVVGAAALLGAFKELRDAAQDETDSFVTTVVVYAPKHEFGGAQPARPFFEPGMMAAAADTSPLETMSGSRWEQLVGEGATVQYAKRAVVEIKKIILEKDIYLTGNLHGSIAWGRSESEATSKSRSQLILPDTAI